MEQNQTPHKRRVRYSGTHPKRFEEKYKELNPEKYADDVKRIIDKGHTPAGMHISIMVQEILDFLNIQPGQVGLDATLGYGGHTRAMLEKLQGNGHIYGLDVDPIESVKTEKRLRDAGFGEDIFTVRLQNFADIDKVVRDTGRKLDFILADLGVSSMQIDNPERGFSYKVDGPLDLRLNPHAGVSGAERLLELNRQELTHMFIENADEPYAEQIANNIMKWRYMCKPIETTTALRECITEALSFLPKYEQKEAVKKSCQRCFQAIRIEVNAELDVIRPALEAALGRLKPGGRMAVITFHSLEDRIVKTAMASAAKGCTCPPSFPVCVCGKKPQVQVITRKPIVSTDEELERNPRARSAKLRVCEKA